MSNRNGNSADVLIVEDNPGDVRLTEEAFREGNIANTLHVATDGVEALDFIYQRGDHTNAPRSNIILMDLNLPRKNGKEVLAEIRDDDDLPHIPVIVFSSSESETDVVRSYELSANAYLAKPVDPEEFIETVRTFEAFWIQVVRLPGGDEGEFDSETA